jgi:acetyl-CoA acetyltransferase
VPAWLFARDRPVFQELDESRSADAEEVGGLLGGQPLGATGGILATKLLYELERSGGRYGLQTMCEGGGQANATIIERLG